MRNLKKCPQKPLSTDAELKQSKEVLIVMKLKTISYLAILSLLSSLGFSAASDQSGINLYSEASAKSKVINTLNAHNQGEYIRFYTNKDGKWAKYANSHTGEVGWVDLGQIEQDKADALRKQILDNLNDRVKYYNNQLSSLSELKNKINKANYQELQQYQYGNAQGFVKTFRAWLGNDGKMHEESNDYRF